MHNEEKMGLYQVILYYEHENRYCEHLIKWDQLTADQMNRLIDMYCKEHDLLVAILHEQSKE